MLFYWNLRQFFIRICRCSVSYNTYCWFCFTIFKCYISVTFGCTKETRCLFLCHSKHFIYWYIINNHIFIKL